MKTIGLLGGMSWESTLAYYRIINEGIKRRLGGLHSAKIVLFRVDFEPIEELQRLWDWQAMGEMLARGAEAILLGCTEIGILVHQDHTPIKLFDTTRLHAELAVEYAVRQTAATATQR